MGVPRTPRPVKAFSSIIFRDSSCLEACLPFLEEKIAPVEERSEEMPFSHTAYYEKEMGRGLRRIFIAFKGLLQREGSFRLKVFANEVESLFKASGMRRLNIDPGYMALEQVVLFTTKGQAHRIYLSQGIFADLTLIFQKGSFRPLPWTYPDYRSEDIVAIFNRWRGKYKLELKRIEC